MECNSIDHIKFLIEQNENRVKIVDTKASIIIAFYGVFLHIIIENYSFIKLHYIIPLFFEFIFFVFYFISFCFLILAIKPITFFACNNEFGKSNFWVKSSFELNKFKINDNIEDLKQDYLILYKKLAFVRIWKYRYFNLSITFLFLIVLISMILLLCNL